MLVHGGGATRAMFANVLAEKGYRSILLDLPGHGSLIDTPLTLDACVDTVKTVLAAEIGNGNKANTIYAGASLGTYIGFCILSKLSFGGAVMMDCGQNVGPDCSLKARMGIWLLRFMAKLLSNEGLMKAMITVSQKSPADWKLVESMFGAGMCFDQAEAQSDCMHTVAPADRIPNYDFPVIFFNGSEDYRDSEGKWLSLCKNQERSYLKVYGGARSFLFT